MKKAYLFLLVLLLLPLVSAQWSAQVIYNKTSGSGAGSLNDGRHFYVDNTRQVLFFPSIANDYLSAYNLSGNTMSVLGNVTDSAGAGSLDGARGIWVDDRNIAYVCASVDDYISEYNVSNPQVLTARNLDYVNSTGVYAVNNCWDVIGWKVGSNYFLAVASIASNNTVIFNITNSASKPIPIGYWQSNSGSCNMANARDIRYDADHKFIFTTSNSGSTLGVLNVSNPVGALNCIYSITNTSDVSPSTIQNLNGLYYENNTLYTGSGADGNFVIFNVSSNGVLTVLGNYMNNTATSNGVNSMIDVTVKNNTAFLSISLNPGRIVLINVTDKTNPQPILNFNGTSALCPMNTTRQIVHGNSNIFYTTSSSDKCFYIMSYSTGVISDSCVYSGTGNFVQNNTVCNITSNVSVQTGYKWIVQNSTIWAKYGIYVNGYSAANFISGELHWINV